MSSCFYLALQYLRYHKGRALLLLICLSIITCLPLGVRTLIHHYQQELENRARTTPLVLGVRGHRFDLVMSALYFRVNLEAYSAMADLDALRESGRASTYPLFVRHTASGVPIVGTSIDYFEYRGLRPVTGSLPMLLGDVVLGANAAEQLGAGPGSTILSDQVNLYSLAAQYPLKMKVVGVLAPSGTADDEAIFADLKTTWVIEGLAHGHDDMTSPQQERNVLSRDEHKVVAGAGITTYVEVTPDNIDSFHFHGDPAALPLTSVICVPVNEKSATILKARYKLSKDRQLLDPASVIDELLQMVFRVEAFLHSSFALVATATAMLLGLIVLLSIRLRRDEFHTLHAIGCSRQTVAGMVILEWLVIAATSFAFSAALIALTLYLAPNISRWL